MICQGVLVDRLFFVPSLCLFLIPFSPCSNSTHAIYAIFGASKELLGGFSTNTLPFSYDEFQFHICVRGLNLESLLSGVEGLSQLGELENEGRVLFLEGRYSGSFAGPRGDEDKRGGGLRIALELLGGGGGSVVD